MDSIVGNQFVRKFITVWSADSALPNEIVTAQQEVENESLKKLCNEMDQKYIELDFEIEAEAGVDKMKNARDLAQSR